MNDQFWQPDKETRSAIRRGDRLGREYFERKSIEYQLMLIERLAARQAFKTVQLPKGRAV